MMHYFRIGGIVLIVAIFCSCSSVSKTDNSNRLNPELSGGSSTIFDDSDHAFSHPSPRLTADERALFFTGESFFDQNWVTALSSTEARDGLGPFFNARSCIACHQHDGRGKPPESGEPFVDLLLRLSIPGEDNHGGPKEESNYGGQLQGFSIQGLESEGVANVTYTESLVNFADGTSYALAVPHYTITDLAYGPIATDVMLSARVAPAMIGMGLLEGISESDILSLEDENDNNEDGISGRANWVWNDEKKAIALGRFGWKANQPSIRQQVAGAFLGDIGITSPLFLNQNITDAEKAATQATIHGGDPELSEKLLERVTFYSQNLAVPARRNVTDPDVLKGEALFSQLRCVKCHQPNMTSNGETIHPYTDLLLHDMGEALADNRPDFKASGKEWRTPPLWGIGLQEKVNGHTRFLHDGRARSLTEAILWHGGEAEKAQQHFKQLSKSDRDALVVFLGSL